MEQMPDVSIGLPVYNGERFLREAIDSLLNQSFADFELIISDNASTDSTEMICRDYVKRDVRVRYCRQSENMGAAANFNFVFEEAKGRYFKWASHDDLMDETYIERSVSALDSNPSAVLCFAKVIIIDEKGEKCENYKNVRDFCVKNTEERFKALVYLHKCYEIFGVIRASSLSNTSLIGGYSHGDGVLLAHLGLKGEFIELPNCYFYARKHAGQSMMMSGDRRAYSEWFDLNCRGRIILPYWRIAIEYVKIIWKESLPMFTKYVCCRHLARFVWLMRRSLARDVLAAGRQLSKRVFGLGAGEAQGS